MASNFDYNQAGDVYARTFYSGSTVSLVSVGVQLFMCVYGSVVFLETPKPLRQGRIPYIAIGWVIFLISTLPAALDALYAFRMLYESTSGKEAFRIVDRLESEWPRTLSLSSVSVTTFVGDGLLLYRAYVIWKDKWWFTVLPTLTYLGSVAMGIRVLLPQSVPSIRINASVWTFLTVSMNIMVTFLISFRLIQMRRSLTRLMPSRSLSECNYSGVLSILIDSALPLTVFGLGYAISLIVDAGVTNASTKRWQIVNIVFATLYYSFTSLSPQMIIFRVTTGRSWLHNPANTDSALSRPIEFAAAEKQQTELSQGVSGAGESSDWTDSEVKLGRSAGVVSPV